MYIFFLIPCECFEKTAAGINFGVLSIPFTQTIRNNRESLFSGKFVRCLFTLLPVTTLSFALLSFRGQYAAPSMAVQLNGWTIVGVDLELSDIWGSNKLTVEIINNKLWKELKFGIVSEKARIMTMRNYSYDIQFIYLKKLFDCTYMRNSAVRRLISPKAHYKIKVFIKRESIKIIE